MKDFLMYCYFQGMSVSSAVSLVSSCHGRVAQERSIKLAKATIKEQTGNDWE